ncbi:class F sortase [Streptomyces sp. enrichment culture]|uniref:class F sortase n=1 Tax=Streptomyces sp. enrichment culture TaxID=1795815 RepID=UPI003F558F6E
MPDTVRRPAVAAAALATATAAVLGVVLLPSGTEAAPAADFGAAPPVRTAAVATAPGPARQGADPVREAPPERVRVAGIGLDARVEAVGVNPEGDMTVPDDPAVAGWYRYGPAPGSPQGSAVLVGHVDSDTGDLGEFAALREVSRGETVEVRRAGADPAVYRVVARTTVPKDELPPSVFSRTGAPVLTLITCAPPFEPERGGYTANLVVTAEPVNG